MIWRLSLVTLVLGTAACSSSHQASPPRSATTTSATVSAPSTTGATTGATTSATTGAACVSATSTPGGSSQKETNPPGDIPDNQAFFSFSPPSGAYRVDIPEGWSRADATDAVTFSDRYNSIRIELAPAAAAPTPASAESAEVPRIKASARCFTADKVTTVKRKAGDAVLITYGIDSEPNAVTGKVAREDVERYEFWRNGTEAIITLAAPTKSDNVDPWLRVTNTFTWR